MTEFGLHLKQAREGRGISLRQIAAATKISTGALEALERGDFSRLPGGIFSRAFVRAYAVEVGLDPEETVRQYTELSDAAAAASTHVVQAAEITDDDRMFLERQRQAGVWLRIIAVLFVVGVTALVSWWRVSVARGHAAVAPTVVTEPAPPPVAAPVAEAPAATTAAPETAAAPVVPESVTVQLHADASCWVQVTTDGRLVFSRNLTAGESQSFTGKKEVAVQFGNAGAISWMVNGKAAKALGAAGEVTKASITPETVSTFWKE